MLTKAFCAIATTVVLLLSTASAALAAPDLATLTRAPAATREILTLAPGETEASTTAAGGSGQPMAWATSSGTKIAWG